MTDESAIGDEPVYLHRFGERGEWWVVAQGALLALAALGPGKGQSWPAGWRRAGKLVGLPLVLTGMALVASGSRDLGANLTPLPHPKDDATLVREGVYGVVRHPIYSGMIFATLGAGLLTGNRTRVLAGLALLALLDAKARREEAWLTDMFPEYPAYSRTVKKLIPWIY